jgi:hypothetical protein
MLFKNISKTFSRGGVAKNKPSRRPLADITNIIQNHFTSDQPEDKLDRDIIQQKNVNEAKNDFTGCINYLKYYLVQSFAKRLQVGFYLQAYSKRIHKEPKRRKISINELIKHVPKKTYKSMTKHKFVLINTSNSHGTNKYKDIDIEYDKESTHFLVITQFNNLI